MSETSSLLGLERPEVLGDRAYLTDEEVATLQARAAGLFNGDTDAAFDGSVFEDRQLQSILADRQRF